MAIRSTLETKFKRLFGGRPPTLAMFEMKSETKGRLNVLFWSSVFSGLSFISCLLNFSLLISIISFMFMIVGFIIIGITLKSLLFGLLNINQVGIF